MDIISTTILAAWFVFGLSTSQSLLPQDEGQYKILPIPVNQIVWADDSDKLRTLTFISLVEEHMDLADKKPDYSIFFPMEKSVPFSQSFDKFMKDIPDNTGFFVGVTGFASPDGENPKHQYNLAVARAKYISDALKFRGVQVEYEDAKVCDYIENPASCWRVDVKTLEGLDEIAFHE